MNATIPNDFLDLLNGPVVAALATVMPSGQPQVNPVWCSYADGHLLVNSARGRAKDRNMRERPRVTALLIDPKNPYRWIEIRGNVVEATERGADAHIDDLAEIYTGKRPYAFRQPGEQRVMYRIKPERVMTMSM
jgi:PPOX class probable F420-dependent enzyme